MTLDTAPDASGPLSGVLIVDLTQMLSGPYCSMMLADMGATVVKIEPPDGDLIRSQGPYFSDDNEHHFGGYFGSVNRNKLGVCVNLKEPAGREILMRMARSADILLENFRVGVMDRLGLSYETLHEVNPRMVYACIRGFGDPRTGPSPYTHWPAFDVVAQAMGGLMGINGPGPEQPMKVGPGVGDIFPASLAAFGIISALYHASRTGEGQFVDVSMYDSVLALCERIVFQYSYTGEIPCPQGSSHPLLCPFDNFPAADGWVTIAAPRDSLWQELVRIIGRPELGGDPRYATNEARVQNAAEVRAILANWCRQRHKKDIMAELGGLVPAGPINTAEDIFSDPHAKARDMLISLEHPGSQHSGTFAGPPIKMSTTRPRAAQRAPLLGEHTRQILAEFGYHDQELTDLLRKRVIASV